LQEEILSEISEDLLSVPPLIFRLVRRRIAETAMLNLDLNITPLQFAIIKLLEKEGSLRVSEIGERLQVAKAQMTKLIDKLVALNMVERKVDTVDRRNINITLNNKARKILEENKIIIMQAIQEIIAALSDEDVKNLSLSLRTIRDIFLKTQ
jgi:MarR family transcriptional regulator, organic hydroperoxide resistance regulator